MFASRPFDDISNAGMTSDHVFYGKKHAFILMFILVLYTVLTEDFVDYVNTIPTKMQELCWKLRSMSETLSDCRYMKLRELAKL